MSIKLVYEDMCHGCRKAELELIQPLYIGYMEWEVSCIHESACKRWYNDMLGSEKQNQILKDELGLLKREE